MSTVWNGNGTRIRMCEVGTRDELQMEQQFVPTEDKIALVNALSHAGLANRCLLSRRQQRFWLRDAEIVMREIERVPGVVYTAQLPNMRGAGAPSTRAPTS